MTREDLIQTYLELFCKTRDIEEGFEDIFANDNGNYLIYYKNNKLMVTWNYSSDGKWNKFKNGISSFQAIMLEYDSTVDKLEKAILELL